MSDQCALNESGGLKDAEDIEFFHSESEATPLPSSSAFKNPGNAGGYYSMFVISVTLVMLTLTLRASTW
jgi:hypothetical protein